jgi:dipeptidyl-peptidase-4
MLVVLHDRWSKKVIFIFDRVEKGNSLSFFCLKLNDRLTMRISHFLLALAFISFSELVYAQETKLTNDLIWYSSEFRGESVQGVNSMSDGLHYTSLQWNDEVGSAISKYAYATGDSLSVIASSKDIFNDNTKSIEGYSFSGDESKLLIQTETNNIYRHSFSANYYIYDLKTKRAYPLADFDSGKQRLAQFSPKGDLVAFVRDNDIYIYDIEFREEEKITFDGKANALINGYPDWVYEEEFGFDRGFFWSPNGDRIAYYKFDESKVKEFQMAMYGELYPDQYTFKYPKAGEENSVVSVYVYDLNAMTSKRVDIGNKKDIYIPRIKWTKNNDKLCVMSMNRHQNHLEFLLADMGKAQPFELKTDVIFSEKSDTYIDISDDLTFLADGSTYLWTSQRDGFNHVYQFNMKGEVVKQVTSGDWDVIEFLGYDEVKSNIYFLGSAEGPLEQHVYTQGIKKSDHNKLSENAGNNSAVFSDSFKFYINYHSDANTPSYITLHNSKGKEIRVLADNKSLNKTLKKYDLGKKEFFQFKNSGGTDLNCWMIKPKDFDPAKKYPVLVAIYGGPGHNTVKDSWGGTTGLWHHLMAQEGYIVVSCDPRGTMYRGKEFMHSTYMEMGKLETEDFIDFAKHMQGKSFVDPDRIGVQGWSYGGYMTSLAMTKGADQYKAGIAVAPVTNWRYYDSIYTERFMRTPQENADGYDNNSPINHVDKMKGSFLLVHGSADDNVHYQNTMEMIDALVQANKEFDLFIYPNKNHGIYGGTTRLHLFNKMTNFLLDNL